MKKVKRYNTGTSEEDIKKLKEEGLKASKDEKVGLLERLRMGNIDDPKSEAYSKFGAGRGLAERSKAASVTPPSTEFSRGFPGMGAPVIPKPVEPTPDTTPVGLRGALTPQGTGEGGVSPGVQGPSVTPRPVPKPAPKSAPKPAPQPETRKAAPDMSKAIAAAGGASGRQAAPKTSELRSVARTRAGTPIKETMDARNRAGQKVSSDFDVVAPALLGLAGMAAYKGMKDIKQKKEDELNEARPSSMGTRSPRIHEIDPLMSGDLERMSGEGGPNFKKGGKVKAKPVKKYASGGKVSSASTRADGIAKRGKTKCKVY